MCEEIKIQWTRVIIPGHITRDPVLDIQHCQECQMLFHTFLHYTMFMELFEFYDVQFRRD